MKNLSPILRRLLSGLLIVLVTSCRGIFVQDPIVPQLPKYSEAGNNVAGAFVNNDIWRSVVQYQFFTVDFAPSVISFPGDSITLIFYGELGVRSAIEFHLTGLKINSYEDLLNLNDQKIQLDGIHHSGYYRIKNNPIEFKNKGIGQIYFKNVSRPDTTSVMTIAGTFGFLTDDSTKISYGRFDYKFSKFLFKHSHQN